jgi:uncharacterized protein with HEPN domain
MDHDSRGWLWDVRRAADDVAEFVQGRGFADYLTDRLLRSAVERQLEIIGEALNRLAREAPEIAARIPDSATGHRHAQCADPWLSRRGQCSDLADRAA